MIELFKVSICMITYNHEKFIAKAIEGVLMQKTNFHFDLIIGEDCSSDNTRKICIDYKNKYPENIILRLPKENLGCEQNFVQNLNVSIDGYKYCAVCEGDDYWTDPLKLQKQVDYLQENHTCGLVYTNVQIFEESSQSLLAVIPRFVKNEADIVKELLKSKYIEFVSILMRTQTLKKLLIDYLYEEFANNVILDTRLILEFAHQSKIGYIADTTAVYRHHLGGITRPTNINKYLKMINESYELRKKFVTKYQYSKQLLGVPVCNFNRAIVFKAYETKNFLLSLKIISNIKIIDLLRFNKSVRFENKFDFKIIVKFFLIITGLRSFILSLKK